jgi:hypothetical protein
MAREWDVPGYTEVKVLGSGGFGEVVLARHDASGAAVAIKYLRGDLLADPEFAALFRAEAAVLASLDDPIPNAARPMRPSLSPNSGRLRQRPTARTRRNAAGRSWVRRCCCSRRCGHPARHQRRRALPSTRSPCAGVSRTGTSARSRQRSRVAPRSRSWPPAWPWPAATRTSPAGPSIGGSASPADSPQWPPPPQATPRPSAAPAAARA